MAAGVGKTYRMLQEGRQAQNEGRDVVIGYLEPHDRPETTALAEGLEIVPRVAIPHGGLVLGEMDVDAVIARKPELALVDELAHTNAPGSRNEKRYQDIDEILEAGIDVISTVNIQHLESLNDTIFELTTIRVRETFPDRVLDEADEVVLVDLAPEALQQRLEAGKVYPKERAEVALINFFRLDNLSSLRELALREVAEDVEARRRPTVLEPLSQQAVSERILAMIEPQPKSQRILRRAWRSAQRLGSEIDAVWVRRPGRPPSDEEATQLAALRRLASVLGVHFLEEEGDDLVATVRRVAFERGSTYIFVGTPDERRRVEILRGSLLSRMVRELPGIDIRVVANRADRPESPLVTALVIVLGALVVVLAVALAYRSRPPRRLRRAARRSPHSRPLHRRQSSTQPCSTPRSASPTQSTRCSSPPICCSCRSSTRWSPRSRARSPSQCRFSKRSSTPPCAPAFPSTLGSRKDAHPPTHSNVSGTSRRFDRIIAPAPTQTDGSSNFGDGFTPKDLTWILTHAPAETLVLRPDPAGRTTQRARGRPCPDAESLFVGDDSHHATEPARDRHALADTSLRRLPKRAPGLRRLPASRRGARSRRGDRHSRHPRDGHHRRCFGVGCPHSAPSVPSRLDWQWRTLTEATTFLREHGIRPFIEAAVGNPALAILETAQALDVDLVVLGGGDSREWRQLLHGLDCDVLLVVPDSDVGSQDEP